MRNPKDIKIGEFTLKEILERHKHWLYEDCEGWEDMQANLDYANLSGVDLSNIILRYANLSNANLRKANLHNADLYSAYLEDVDLNNADLRGADLESADLECADLRYANLSNANLRKANLHCANLRDATLFCANLYSANLEDADLYNANLCNANLSDTYLCGTNLNNSNLSCANLSTICFISCNLSGAIGNLVEFRKGKILTESIIGYKKCRDNVIVTLEIPRGATVFSINGNKCRTNKAKVINIEGACRAYSNYNNMSYYVGDEFTVYNFNCEYNIECAEGIHFYMTREEAENVDI